MYYYPYLRGKQNELLAIRELVDAGLLNGNVIPIVEPLKKTSTFDLTLEKFIEKDYPLYLTINPQVGNFEVTESFKKQFENTHSVFPAILMSDDKIKDLIGQIAGTNYIVIYQDRSDITNQNLLNQLEDPPRVNFITNLRYKRDFKNKDIGLFHDVFEKQKRNSDYAQIPEEFYSDDHLYFLEEGYKAFSDYSIIGADYILGGFAPVAVAIHIVYFDQSNILNIQHFVSDTNDDISNPAGKFGEALKKLVDWYENEKERVELFEDLNASTSIDEFIKLYNEKKYPGLGYVKKLSLKHHLEIMDRFLGNRG